MNKNQQETFDKYRESIELYKLFGYDVKLGEQGQSFSLYENGVKLFYDSSLNYLSLDKAVKDIKRISLQDGLKKGEAKKLAQIKKVLGL